jgi:hypothetical protein
MELLVIIALVYAIKSAVDDTKKALRKSRDAYSTSADLRFPGSARSGRVTRAVRHDAGFWAGQAAQGFPAARHGLAAGWHAGRQAQAEAREVREKAKADHLETRVRLIPEVRAHVRRQREALARLHAEREAREGAREGVPQSVMAPPQHPAGTAPSHGPRIGYLGQDGFWHGDEPDPAYGMPADPVASWDEPLPSATAAPPGEGREIPGEGSAGEQADPAASQDEPLPSDTEGGGRTYSYGPADVPAGWPAGGDAGMAHAQARRMSEGGNPWVVTEYPAAGGGGTTVATYLDGNEIQATAEQVSAWEATASERRRQYSRMEQEAGQPAPSQSPQPEGEPTVPVAADTTYDGVLKSMTAEKAQAEVTSAEAATASRQAEARAGVVAGASRDAAALSDSMQALEVDGGTLSAMADHLDAHAAAERAEQDVQEATVAAEKAHKLVLETAETVESTLKRGHSGLDEAHKNAPVVAADKAFYGEG